MNRLIVVSNRLPFALDVTSEDLWTVTPAAGGLVSAIEPVLRERGGTWIGWPGIAGKIPRTPLEEATRDVGYAVVPVSLSEAERDEFYYGYSNEVIWPLFHDLQSFCHFEPAFWDTYKTVNERYAEAIARHCQPGDFIWVHDYHLMYVAQALRARGVDAALTFFLHIPFPPFDLRNFLQCVRRVLPEAEILPRAGVQRIRYRGREIRASRFPIGIDFESFEKGAASEEVAQRTRKLRAAFPDCQLMLGADRLDYSKGIPERLRAFRDALERHSELQGRVVLIQNVVPSRVEIPRYHEFKDRIDRLVGDINGRFSTDTWLPVHYRFRSLTRDDLLAHYRACEIALVTPLKDGMNLVAKEYCACSVDKNDGVLILSQFAGAAEQLKPGAVLVNPYDVEQVADTILKVFRMNDAERRARMKRMRRVVRDENVFWWVDSFLKAGSQLKTRSARIASRRHAKITR